MPTEESIDTLTINDIRNEIAKFKNDQDVQKLSHYYQSKSFSEILGVSRRELSHSSFLAWLLNPDESHALHQVSIKKLLDILVLYSRPETLAINKELYDAIITDDLTIKNVEIETEKVLQNAGRLDIYIELFISYNGIQKTVKVIIENKVTAKETNDQTRRYYEYFEKDKNDDVVLLYVYLTPLSSLELIELSESQCACKAFIQINYQAIVDLLIEPVLHQDIPIKTKMILAEYLQSLSQPALEDEENQQKGLIMAIGNEERELLAKFWDKNQKLILASLYAMSSDPDQDKDVRDSIGTALDSISEKTRDRSLLSISYNNQVEVEHIKKADLGFKTIEILDKFHVITEETFDFLKTDTSCGFDLLKTKVEVTDNEEKYRKYRVNGVPELTYNGHEYYVARNWGIGNIEKFMEKMSRKFPSLQYEFHK